MFAPQNQQPNVIEAMSGSMEDWYNAVDEAVKKSYLATTNTQSLHLMAMSVISLKTHPLTSMSLAIDSK